jgi:hypothetical protein
MILRAIKTFIRDPEPVESADEVVAGLNVADGVIRVEEPIRSPVRGATCAAFFYKSFLFIPSGRGGSPPSYHSIKQAQAFACFTLEMEGGNVQVIPTKPGNFSQREHQDLQNRYGQSFQGVEEIVMPGAKVRVRGKVKIQNGVKVLHMKELTVLDKQVAAAGMAGDRKKRKKGGK